MSRAKNKRKAAMRRRRWMRGQRAMQRLHDSFDVLRPFMNKTADHMQRFVRCYMVPPK